MMSPAWRCPGENNVRPRVITSCLVILVLLACPSAAQLASSAAPATPSTPSLQRIKRALAATPPPGLLDRHEYVSVTAEAPPEVSLFGDFDFSDGLARPPTGALYRYDLGSGAVALFKLAGKAMAGLFTREEEPIPAVPPVLGHAEREQALAQVLGHPAVLGATIDQNGPTVTLMLTVPVATTLTTARQLGNDFLRFVEQLGPMTSASHEDIEGGHYDYIVSVRTPTEAEVAIGGRPTDSPSITWRSTR